MLVLALNDRESILAEKNFELKFFNLGAGRRCVEVTVLETRSYVFRVNGIGDADVGAVGPDESLRLDIRFGSILRLCGCDIRFDRHGTSGVKCMIAAPKSIRFTRPAQHGTSLRSA